MRSVFLSLALFVSFVLSASSSRAQVFPIDTIAFNGNPDKLINIVILGDGYTISEQTTFVSDARTMINYLFSQAPWSNYKQYFNIFAIKVPSAQSGVTHPNTAPDCASQGQPTETKNTYFGCAFDSYSIHRLVVPTKMTAAAQVLAKNFPNYDQVLMISHSEYYGGSGGPFATGTVHQASGEIMAHEVGHSFASLADEYWAGPQYAGEHANMTAESSASLVRWKNWLAQGTGIGVYAFTEDPTWHKPHNDCKMQYLGSEFCSVCKEAIIEHIHELAKPIVSFSPVSLTQQVTTDTFRFSLDTLLEPTPNTVRSSWSLNNKIVEWNDASLLVDAKELKEGMNTVSVTVQDTGGLVRLDSHATSHLYSITWNVTKLVPKPRVVAPLALAFPDIRVGAQLDTSIWIENTSTVRATVTSFALTQTKSAFSLTDSSTHVLGANDSVQLRVRFSPSAKGSLSGSITVRILELPQDRYTIQLTGRATDSKLTATALDFGTVFKGKSKKLETDLKNLGDADVTINGIVLSDTVNYTVVIPGLPIVIKPAMLDNLAVEFHPVDTSIISAKLTLTTSEANPLEIALIGRGEKEPDTVQSSVRATVNRISASLFPNPSTSKLRVSVTSEQAEQLRVELVTLDGKIIRLIESASPASEFSGEFDLSDLAPGTYLAVFHVGGAVYQEKFIKE